MFAIRSALSRKKIFFSQHWTLLYQCRAIPTPHPMPPSAISTAFYGDTSCRLLFFSANKSGDNRRVQCWLWAFRWNKTQGLFSEVTLQFVHYVYVVSPLVSKQIYCEFSNTLNTLSIFDSYKYLFNKPKKKTSDTRPSFTKVLVGLLKSSDRPHSLLGPRASYADHATSSNYRLRAGPWQCHFNNHMQDTLVQCR
jgi:hypothetical protein